MIPILEVELCKNELVTRKANFTHQLQVNTQIHNFIVEISKKISVTPTEVPNTNIFLDITNGILSNYYQLPNGRPLEVLNIQDLKQDFHFWPHHRLAHFRLRHMQPKHINRTSFRSRQTGDKIIKDCDSHSTFNKLGVHKRRTCPFTGSKTGPEGTSSF